MKNLRLIPDTHRYQPKSHLFDGQFGGKYCQRSINKSLTQNDKKTGIKKRIFPYILRHSFATHLLEQGVSLRHIQVFLGNSSSKTTEHYTQVSTQEIGSIVNPLEAYYSKGSGTIHPKNGSIMPLNQGDKENKHT